ncbi:MAG: diguanylate cyclase [Microthrixaceae bacterium]|nr:diguanylate cyclase [Microthrixaceae bacterium]
MNQRIVLASTSESPLFRGSKLGNRIIKSTEVEPIPYQMCAMTAELADARSPKWIRWVAFTSLVAVSVGIVANPGDEYLWITLNNFASFAAAAWATAAGIGAARRCRGREQVAWILMAAGSGLWTLGQIGWAWYQVVLRSEPPMAGALDVLFVGAPVLWTAAVATFVIAPAGLWSRVRGGLEATMVVGAAFVPAWLLILQPVADQSTESTFVVTVNLLYPVMDMLVLGTALFTLTRPRLRSTGRLGVVCFGLVVMSAADAMYWYLTTTGSFQDTNATDSLWIAGFALLALGSGVRRRQGSGNDSVHRHWWLTMSPSLVYAVGLITTFVVLAYPNGRRTTAWEIAAIIAMVLVGTAQRFAVMIENHHLTNGLEEVVARRTAQLAGSKRYFHSLVRASSDMVAVIDTDGEITWVSDAASSQYGLNPSDFIGSQVHERPSLWAVSEAIKAGLPEVQWELTDGQGRTRWASSTISDLRDDPDVQAFVINTRDVTDQVALEEQLRHQAFHDPLTGLPNRALFADRLNQAINRARNTNQLVGVAVIDLNGFKHVNDSHGHLAGDSVLKSVSERLSMLLSSDVTVARLGGDEFAVLFDQITTVDEAEELGNTISEHLRHEVSVNSTRFETSGSVGIAVALPGVDLSVEDLIRDADIAMYRAKGSGSVAAVVFAEEMHQQAQEASLWKAICDLPSQAVNSERSTKPSMTSRGTRSTGSKPCCVGNTRAEDW